MDFMGYNLFFPGLLAGPTFRFETFLDFMERPQKIKPLPWNLAKALTPLLIALPVTVTTLYCMPLFTQTWVLDSPFYLGLSLWQKALILNPIGFIYRTKYYSAWYLSQTFCNLSGLSQSESG